MAGAGLRFSQAGYELPKPLIDVNGQPMIQRAVDSLEQAGNYTFIIQKNPEINDVLRTVYPESNIIEIDYITEGPASTVLLAKSLINTEEPLIVANCDQIMWWNGELFQNFCDISRYDGIVVTYYSNSTKNSYAKINRRGDVVEVKEKEVISKISLNGIHFWSKGSFFVESAEKMILDSDKSIDGEFYVAPSYNKMIESGYNVGIYHIPNEQHNAVGTPDDLREYLRNEDL